MDNFLKYFQNNLTSIFIFKCSVCENLRVYQTMQQEIISWTLKNFHDEICTIRIIFFSFLLFAKPLYYLNCLLSSYPEKWNWYFMYCIFLPHFHPHNAADSFQFFHNYKLKKWSYLGRYILINFRANLFKKYLVLN